MFREQYTQCVGNCRHWFDTTDIQEVLDTDGLAWFQAERAPARSLPKPDNYAYRNRWNHEKGITSPLVAEDDVIAVWLTDDGEPIVMGIYKTAEFCWDLWVGTHANLSLDRAKERLYGEPDGIHPNKLVDYMNDFGVVACVCFDAKSGEHITELDLG